jgi:TPR repeat protein
MDITSLKQRAESGNVVAQSVMGICRLEGLFGVPVDYSEALRFLSGPAENGAPRALACLARMYAEGLGVDQNIDQAISLYKRAAINNDFLAQIELGRIYAHGKGVPVDPVQALTWYSAAVAQSHLVGDCDELAEGKAYLAG